MIAICDDERQDAEELVELIKRTESWKIDPFPIRIFENSLDLIKAIESGQRYRMIFMDIYLKEERGDLTAKKILGLDSEIEIVFQTFSMDFAVQAFELNALHYLVKPVTLEKVNEVLKRYREKKHITTAMEFSSGKKKYFFLPDNIMKIVSEKKGVRIYLKNGQNTWIKSSFQSTVNRMDENKFLVVSRGYLINMDSIQSMDGGKCTLTDGAEILLSRKNREKIRERFRRYLFEQL